MILETARLRLRPPRPDDVPAIVAAMNDWEVAQWVAAPPFPYAAADAEVWIARVLRDHAGPAPGMFAAAALDGDRIVGSVALERREEEPGTAVLGYWLARSAWGLGYATEAVLALVARGFGPMGLDRIVAVTDPANAASRRVLAKAGFRELGPRRRDPPTRRGSPEIIDHELLRPGIDPGARS
jgi:RimJ/RimL family protein N-acetyltransferase